MKYNSPHPGVIYDGELDIEQQRAEAVVRAFKKAWQTADRLQVPLAQRREIAVYLLGVAGYTHGVLLAYDFAEVAAFLGGVADGEFDDLIAGTGEVTEGDQQEELELPEPQQPAVDWDAVPLPPGITAEALVEAFTAVQDELYFEAFGEGGPAWGRVLFHLAPTADGVTLQRASAHPFFDLAEIRAVAHLPHPPPTEIARRGYLTPVDLG